MRGLSHEATQEATDIMTDRYTRKDADRAVERLANVLGKPVGHYRQLEPGEISNFGSPSHTTIPGGWALDWNPTYGGGVIEEIADVPGETWVREPFGPMRRSAREIVDMVRFGLDAIELDRKQREATHA